MEMTLWFFAGLGSLFLYVGCKVYQQNEVAYRCESDARKYCGMSQRHDLVRKPS